MTTPFFDFSLFMALIARTISDPFGCYKGAVRLTIEVDDRRSGAVPGRAGYPEARAVSERSAHLTCDWSLGRCGRSLRCLEEAVAPPEHVLTPDVVDHRLPPSHALVARHGERGPCRRRSPRRIDDDRFAKLRRRAAKQGQHQHVGNLRVLRRHVLTTRIALAAGELS